MPDCCDAKFLEVLRRQVGQDRLVYLVLAESHPLTSRGRGSQPDHEMRQPRPQSVAVGTSWTPSGGVSRRKK